MNKKKKDVLSERIAAVQVKCGSISWEVEEPHNAQTDLELACEYYFPKLVDEIVDLAGM